MYIRPLRAPALIERAPSLVTVRQPLQCAPITREDREEARSDPNRRAVARWGFCSFDASTQFLLPFFTLKKKKTVDIRFRCCFLFLSNNPNCDISGLPALNNDVLDASDDVRLLVLTRDGPGRLAECIFRLRQIQGTLCHGT